MDSHENDSALDPQCTIELVVPPWEKVPHKHDRSSHSNGQITSLRARQEPQEGVEAAKLKQANEVAKAVHVEAQKETR